MKEQGKAILQYDLLGQLVAEYPTIRAGAKAVQVHSSSIIRAIAGSDNRGHCYHLVKNCIWRLATNPLTEVPVIKKGDSGRPKVAVQLVKGDDAHSFDSLSEAGQWMVAQKIITAAKSVSTCYYKSQTIAGYSIIPLNSKDSTVA